MIVELCFYGIFLSIFRLMSLFVSVWTVSSLPIKSPGFAMAFPLFDILAMSFTWLWSDSLLEGIIAIESSSMVWKGRSLTFLRIIAIGIGGPFIACA